MENVLRGTVIGAPRAGSGVRRSGTADEAEPHGRARAEVAGVHDIDVLRRDCMLLACRPRWKPHAHDTFDPSRLIAGPVAEARRLDAEV